VADIVLYSPDAVYEATAGDLPLGHRVVPVGLTTAPARSGRVDFTGAVPGAAFDW